MPKEYEGMFFDRKWVVFLFFVFSSLLYQIFKTKFFQAFTSRYFLSLPILESVVVNFELLLAVSMTGDGEELGMGRMHAFVHSGSNTFFSVNPLCNLAAFTHEVHF